MPSVERNSTEIMKLCPRFDSCSVPICPLDLLQEERDYIKGESRCALAKSYRLKIGQNTQLKYKGLTKSEWAARQRWNDLSETAKAHKKAELRKVSPFIRGNHAPERQGDSRTPVELNKTEKRGKYA